MSTRASRRAVVHGGMMSLLLWPKTMVQGASAHNSATWKVLRVGGGGFLTGLDISPDGSTLIVRTDTYGAYRWEESRQRWTQLVTAESMPASALGLDRDTGVYEIRVAPSHPARFYMAYGDEIYRSDDSGGSWTRTNFNKVKMDANDDFRASGPKMAIDPIDREVVYVGTSRDGLFVTQDGGRAWRLITDIPAGRFGDGEARLGAREIVFDENSGGHEGKTKTIFASSDGSGVYRSTNAGASWMRLEGGPRDIRHAKVARDGVYYAIAGDGSSVWRYTAMGWTNITPLTGSSSPEKGGVWSTIAADPFDSARIVAAKEGGALTISHDRGATWRHAGEIRREARDVPWLAWTQESYMSVGDMIFDPATPDRLLFAEGIGFWYAKIPKDVSDGLPIIFTSKTAGIEQLVANQIVVPPGGKPLLASWDRPVFRVDNPDHYPATHGPDNARAIVMGWALDYAAKTPEFLAGVFNWQGVEKSSFSRDGGRTWTPFPSYPPTLKHGKIGGCIAVSTPSNIVWLPSNNAAPYYTQDGGASWAPIGGKEIPQSGEAGWSDAYYLNRHVVAADRVLTGTFYLYNYLKGLYRSRDGGANWTLVYDGEIAPYSKFNAKLRAAPGHAGHLFFTSGEQGGPGDRHPAPNAFMRSTNGGETWEPVDGVLEAHVFGFGKPRGDYPSILLVGWVDGRYGIWRSDDGAKSWMDIGERPLGILAHVTAIEGDSSDGGRVYVGFGGAGYAYCSMQIS